MRKRIMLFTHIRICVHTNCSAMKNLCMFNFQHLSSGGKKFYTDENFLIYNNWYIFCWLQKIFRTGNFVTNLRYMKVFAAIFNKGCVKLVQIRLIWVGEMGWSLESCLSIVPNFTLSLACVNFCSILREAKSLINSRTGLFNMEGSDKMTFSLYHSGKRSQECDRAPVTCALIGGFREASSCLRGKVSFFSVAVLLWEKVWTYMQLASLFDQKRDRER